MEEGCSRCQKKDPVGDRCFRRCCSACGRCRSGRTRQFRRTRSRPRHTWPDIGVGGRLDARSARPDRRLRPDDLGRAAGGDEGSADDFQWGGRGDRGAGESDAGWAQFTIGGAFSSPRRRAEAQRFVHLEDERGARALLELRSAGGWTLCLDTFLFSGQSPHADRPRRTATRPAAGIGVGAAL